jgi:glycosyltransferase involved in cell wall biosynthesis
VTLRAAHGADKPRQLLISAFGIHMGGGLVLLRALLTAAATKTRETLIDSRLTTSTPQATEGATVRVVPRSFFRRLVSLLSLARRAQSTDILLCFNSLPPLLHSKAHVVTYVQAPHFIGSHVGIPYPRMTRLRLALERYWFNRGVRHTDEIWVQTESMANAVLIRHPASVVRVVPLLDDEMSGKLRGSIEQPVSSDASQLSFFYPADGVGHKNHVRLLLAWQQLMYAGLTPRLSLTLLPEEFARAAADADISISELPNVENLGRISREAVLARIAASSALIFPSLTETLGLPLLEARMLDKPILAAERDFVRDVCAPRETFDPESPRSIARAVRRFITGRDDVTHDFYSAHEFVSRLLSCAS